MILSMNFVPYSGQVSARIIISVVRHRGLFAKVKQRRTHQIANVFHHYQGVHRWVELLKRMRQHIGLKVATCTGIDLYRIAACGMDALGVEPRLLIAFNHADRNRRGEVPDRAF